MSDKAGPDQCPVPGENALFPAQIAGFLAVSHPVPPYPVFLKYVAPVQTVFFEDPFWVCVLEREENGRLSACKLTLGGDPTDGQMYELLLSCWRGLVFSPAVAARMRTDGGNPKRRQRTAASALENRGVGTKAQQALRLQREQGGRERKAARRARDEAEEKRKFQLRQEKKKQKHRGR